MILDHNNLDQKEKNILRRYLFWDQMVPNCLKIDTTH